MARPMICEAPGPALPVAAGSCASLAGLPGAAAPALIGATRAGLAGSASSGRACAELAPAPARAAAQAVLAAARPAWVARLRRPGWVVLALAALAATCVAWPARALPPELAQRLHDLPDAAQAQLRHNGERWDAWTAEQRSDFQRRAAQWEQRPAAERGLRRERYQAWQALGAGERAQIQAAAARYAALPADQQQALRARFDALDRSERRGWLLGPALGVDYPALQPLLAQMPEAEHAAMLAALRGLSPAQRKDLAVLVQRTPPQERARLRAALLSTPAAQRGAWLLQTLAD